MSKKVVEEGVKALFSRKESLWTSFYTSSLELKVPLWVTQPVGPKLIHSCLFILIPFQTNVFQMIWRGCSMRNLWQKSPQILSCNGDLRLAFQSQHLLCILLQDFFHRALDWILCSVPPTNRASKFGHFRFEKRRKRSWRLLKRQSKKYLNW